MKYTQEIVGTHGGALLLERAPGACSGSKIPRVYRPSGTRNLGKSGRRQSSSPQFPPVLFRVRALRLNFAEPTISKPEATYVLRDNHFLDDV